MIGSAVNVLDPLLSLLCQGLSPAIKDAGKRERALYCARSALGKILKDCSIFGKHPVPRVTTAAAPACLLLTLQQRLLAILVKPGGGTCVMSIEVVTCRSELAAEGTSTSACTVCF